MIQLSSRALLPWSHYDQIEVNSSTNKIWVSAQTDKIKKNDIHLELR